jgi:phosphotransferase system enzyme I (PtsI)
MMEIIHAIGTSPGVAIGPVYQQEQQKADVSVKRIPDGLVEAELAALERALAVVRAEITDLITVAAAKVGARKAEIFQAQMMLLDDPEFIPPVREKIKNEKINAAAALDQVIQKHDAVFAGIEDEYIRARIADLHDIGSQIIRQINGSYRPKPHFEHPVIIFADDLSPSETALFDPALILAFATAAGSRTSHTSIMARSLGIPAAVGAGEGLMARVKTGDQAIVDGDEGIVILNPSPETLAAYRERQEQERIKWERLTAYRSLPTITRDGHRVTVAGNMGCRSDLERLLEQGAEGIGLFRTEFLYMEKERLPSEEEQLEIYEEVVRKMAGQPVIIRTLDVGGDKEIPYLNLPSEPNPFLGYRAVRLYFERPEIYKPQLRAILRASCSGPVKIMFPMISSLEEARKGRAIVEEVKKELHEEGLRFTGAIDTGVMIEIPSATLIAGALAEEVDFFSIGTNDLVQYTLAIDRTNETVAHLASHYHPAVLKLIDLTVKAAHAKGIPVGICGEAAADRLFIPFLVGVGIDELSVAAGSVLLTKEAVGKCVKEEAAGLAVTLLHLRSTAEVKEELTAFQQRKKIE